MHDPHMHTDVGNVFENFLPLRVLKISDFIDSTQKSNCYKSYIENWLKHFCVCMEEPCTKYIKWVYLVSFGSPSRMKIWKEGRRT